MLKRSLVTLSHIDLIFFWKKTYNLNFPIFVIGLLGDVDAALAPNLLPRLSTVHTAREPFGPFAQIEAAQRIGTPVSIAWSSLTVLVVNRPRRQLRDAPGSRHLSLPSAAV